MPGTNNNLIILDTSSLLYKAFYALPSLSTSKGEPTGAIYGFFLILFRILKEFSPTHLATCFDYPAPTFRHKEYKEYKAHRPPTPDPLKVQMRKLKEILSLINIKVLEKEGLEADDLIASLVGIFQEQPKLIITGDKDLLQLLDEKTRVGLVTKGVRNLAIYTPERFREEYGFSPRLLPDFKALVGDPSDNIPGIKGVGPKKAQEMLQGDKSLEELLQDPRFSSELRKNKEELLSWKRLVLLHPSLLKISLEELRFERLDFKRAKEIFAELEFKSLMKPLEELASRAGSRTLF